MKKIRRFRQFQVVQFVGLTHDTHLNGLYGYVETVYRDRNDEYLIRITDESPGFITAFITQHHNLHKAL